MKLFEPLSIRGMQVSNRIVFPPMVVGVGLRSRRARAYYAERARGGAGTIVVAATPVDLFVTDEAWKRPGAVAEFIQGIRPVAEAVRQAGAKIGVQLAHFNRYPCGTGVGDKRGEPVAPSPWFGKRDRWEEEAQMRELTIAEIEDIISRFARAAAATKQAGFDFVEFHNAHGYLACQFFSPADNHRTDKYGGDLKGRMRFGLECISAMRLAVGDDYPIFIRFPAWEDRPRGINLEESTRFAVELEKAGVDCFDVSVGTDAEGVYSPVGKGLNTPGKKARRGTFAWLAEAVKQKVKVPVIAVGRINSPKVAEAILTRDRADLIAIGRQLIADPFWPKKVMEGRAKEIVACDSCGGDCHGFIRSAEFGCKLNPRAGKEWEIPPPE